VKIAIGIGEPSGDLIASSLIKYFKSKNPNINFIGITGPKSQKEGLRSDFDISSLSVNGFVDVLKNYRALWKFRNNFLQYLYKEKPDIYIGVDAPDFNFFIERKLKKKGCKVFHYVCPSIWAWRMNRYKNFHKTFDHLFYIFNHEKKLLKSLNVSATFVGHPIASLDSINCAKIKSRNKLRLDLNAKIISLLPGSRESEINNNLPVLFLSAKEINKKIKNLIFLIPILNKDTFYKINKLKREYGLANINAIIGHSHVVLNSSDFAIISSGTATLEAAFMKIPMIIIYKLSFFSYHFFKYFLKIKFIGLPNILLNKLFVPEFYKNVDSKAIAKKTIELLDDKDYLIKLKTAFSDLHKKHKLNTNQIIYKSIFNK
jgi:lipid-A-disaccharide synthase